MTTKKQPKLSRYKFKPSKELLDFADDISKNYKKLKLMDYYSENKKYRIQKLPNLDGWPNYGIKTSCRVSLDFGTIQLNHKRIKDYCANFIFYSILWCVCKKEMYDFLSELDKHLADTAAYYIESDRQTIMAYKKTKRPLKRVIIDNIKSLAHAKTQMNIERVKKLLKTKPYKK